MYYYGLLLYCNTRPILFIRRFVFLCNDKLFPGPYPPGDNPILKYLKTKIMNSKKIIPGMLLVLLLPVLSYFSSCSGSRSGTGGSVRDTTSASVSRKVMANGTGGSVRDTTSAKKN